MLIVWFGKIWRWLCYGSGQIRQYFGDDLADVPGLATNPRLGRWHPNELREHLNDRPLREVSVY